MGKKLRVLSALLLAGLLVILAAAGGTSREDDSTRIHVPSDKMLHVKRVGFMTQREPHPYYYELYFQLKNGV